MKNSRSKLSFGLIILFSTLITISAYSQKSKLTAGILNLQNGDIEGALAISDIVSYHEETEKLAKTWKFRGDIFYKIGFSADPEMKKISNEPFIVMLTNYEKAMSLEGSDRSTLRQGMKRNMQNSQVYINHAGKQLFNNKDYESATELFESSVKVHDFLGIVDSASVLDAGLSNHQLHNYRDAQKFYERAIALEYDGLGPYHYLSSLYQLEGNPDAAIEVMNDAASKYPYKSNFDIEIVNNHINTGTVESYRKAIELLQSEIIYNRNNAQLPFTLGSLHEGLGESIKAIVYYEKAIEIDSKYFAPHFNLGVYYYNLAADHMNKANEIWDNDLYDKEIDKAMENFRIAMTHFEKADKIQNNHPDVLNSLKIIYIRLGMDMEFEAMKKRIDDLNK